MLKPRAQNGEANGADSNLSNGHANGTEAAELDIDAEIAEMAASLKDDALPNENDLAVSQSALRVCLLCV